ncbi:MAG: hypothetical protein HN869_04520, partial [Verrucomicrobia bacterium]|nr:hypothetical protein [Verrucomicrobiota bacterium]
YFLYHINRKFYDYLYKNLLLVKDFQYLDQSKKPAKLRRFRKWEYEIAISPKEQESWTFVNGNGMNALQLRKIFKFLPKEDKEFQFPEVKVEELK